MNTINHTIHKSLISAQSSPSTPAIPGTAKTAAAAATALSATPVTSSTSAPLAGRVATFIYKDSDGSRYKFTLNNTSLKLTQVAKDAIFSTFREHIQTMKVGEKAKFKAVETGIELKVREETKIIATPQAVKLSETFKTPKLLESYATEFTQSHAQGLPNVGNTCFLNAAVQIMMDPGIRDRLLQCPEAFKGGKAHPLYGVLNNYSRGRPVTKQQMIDLEQQLVRDGMRRNGAEQLDVGEALDALRGQIDHEKLKQKFPGLVVSKAKQHKLKPVEGKLDEQLLLPLGGSEPDTFLYEIRIDASRGLAEGIENALYDKEAEPMIVNGELRDREFQQEIPVTVPETLIVNLERFGFLLDRISLEDQGRFIQLYDPKVILENERSELFQQISKNPTLAQKAVRLVAAKETEQKMKHIVVPLGKIASSLLEVPLSFRTPVGFAKDGKSEELELTSFAVHQGENMGGGHYVAYIRRGNKYYYMNDSAPPHELNAEQFLDYAKQARKLVYSKKKPALIQN